MRLTIERDVKVKELLEDVERTYGMEEDIEARLEEQPNDWGARLALHDLNEYSDRDPEALIQESRQVILPDDALDQLTFRCLRVLFTVKKEGGEVEGIRALARQLDRDVKNVSQDVDTLERLALLLVEERGPGRAYKLSLPGERITLHLMEPRHAEA